MPKDLIIVESPAKVRTLAGFLGKSYDIRASMGHVRDLPKNKLGVDTEKDFKPSYTAIPDRREVLRELKRAADGARKVYLASDPDREGEAIAWHLSEALGLKSAERIEFNEITQRAVREALEHPRKINVERVNAQQARRVLDRLVGYKISPLLWKKVQRNLSAGRVQSVAVRLIVDRERQIEGFESDEYWSLSARLTPVGRETPFLARLVQIDGAKPELKDSAAIGEVLARLEHRLVEQSSAGDYSAQATSDRMDDWRITDINQKEQRRNPQAPFITSTLQQEAARKLGFTSRRTMQVAQQLYEGMDLGKDGHTGLITYMRTDSVQMSTEARDDARKYVSERFGRDFVPERPRDFRSSKTAQEAHEAIRPTSAYRHPDDLKPHLASDQLRLYTLIWQRFLASQMAAALFDVTTAEIPVGGLLFRATGRVLRFEGYTAVYIEGRDDASEDEDDARRLPPLNQGDLLELLALLPEQHFTEPPPRFSEATLVKALEERGIGRPSTYAQIISTIQDREYVHLAEKRFRPTPLGCTVTDQLVRHFPRVFSVDFTAEVEQELDDIASGERDWVGVLEEFYTPFVTALADAEERMERVKPEAEVTDTACPDCGAAMVIRTSRRGKFLGCSAFPTCKKTLELPVDPAARPESEDGASILDGPGQDCPKCGREMVRRSGRFGEFWGCSGYPECKTIVDPKRVEPKPLGMPCPTNCGGGLQERVSRRGKPFYGCDRYPACDFVCWDRPTELKCDSCGYPLGEKISRGEPAGHRCTNQSCPTAPPRSSKRPARRGVAAKKKVTARRGASARK